MIEPLYEAGFNAGVKYGEKEKLCALKGFLESVRDMLIINCTEKDKYEIIQQLTEGIIDIEMKLKESEGETK